MKGSFKTAIDNNTTCNMPVHAFCRPFNPNQVSVFGKCSGLSIPFETKEKVLAQYIPDCFEILEPLVDVRFLHCGDVDFLSGSSYNILDVTIPVQFNEKGNKLTGLYPFACSRMIAKQSSPDVRDMVYLKHSPTSLMHAM